ncbi:HTH-type transcriptional regulator ImmR [compost metagenome]
MSSLGSRIRDLRKKKKLTQQYLADKLSMGRSNFGHIENDRVIPSSEDLQKIADILETKTDYLLGRYQDTSNFILEDEKSHYYTSSDLKDIKKMLEDGEVLFDGVPIDEAQRRRIMDILTGLFWEAKESRGKK